MQNLTVFLWHSPLIIDSATREYIVTIATASLLSNYNTYMMTSCCTNFFLNIRHLIRPVTDSYLRKQTVISE